MSVTKLSVNVLTNVTARKFTRGVNECCDKYVSEAFDKGVGAGLARGMITVWQRGMTKGGQAFLPSPH